MAIRVIDDQLQVDTYWPGGTMLLAMHEDVFRLDSTNRWLRFERDSTGHVTGARYELFGQQVPYRKITNDAVG